MAIIIFVIILGILVIIHEFGHFIIAKKSGVLVEEFAFGFPPKIFSKKIGETTYSLNLFPLGGYVKLYGEEYQDLDKTGKARLAPTNRAFVNKKPWQKTLVILGGVLMNIVLAVTIYYGLLATNNFQSEPLPLFIKQYNFRFGQQEGRVVVANIVKDSPAQKAGITTEDTVLSFRSPPNLLNFTSITSASQLISLIKNKNNQPIEIQLENIRNGQVKTVKVIPYYNKELKRAIIGANLVDAAIIKYQTPKQKIFSGFMHSYNLMVYNYSVFGDLISASFKTKKLAPVSDTVSGPIGIFSVINEIVNTSGRKLVINVLNVIALLSLSLAVMNVLPFPALDGGRLVFIIYEWISGRPPNKNVEKYVNFIGFAFLIFLAILVSINDIIRLIK